MSDAVTHVTVGEAETRALAAELAATLAPGAVILLHGDLGAGKTVFVKGLAEGLGLTADAVTSPTFTLVHEYQGGRLSLFHLDLYRLAATELDEVGLDPDQAERGVVVVEWAERLSHAPSAAIVVAIGDLGGEAREVRVGTSDSAA